MAQPYNQFSPLNALSVVQQQGDMGRQLGRERQLNQLASQAYGAQTPEQRQGLLTSMAVIDPASAQSQEKAFAYSDERRNTNLVNMAKLLTSAPEQARPGLWQQFLPTLSQFGLSQLPDQYNAETAPLINQTAQSLVQAYGGGGSGGNVQSTYVNRQGQRVAIMRDGSQQVLGDSDARTQLRDQPGLDPSIIDLRTGQATPVVASQQGARGSYNIDPSLPPEVQAGIRAAEAAGVEYTGQTGTGIAAARQDPSMMITPYQQAQLANQERANTRADQAAEDARHAREQASQARQAAAQQKAQVAQQAINTRQAQLSDVQRGVARVEAALNALDQSRIGTGPAAQLAQRYLPAGQELETAVNAMNNTMLALTRVPGIGAQSDLEARIASMRFPQLDRDEAVNRRTLEDLKSYVQQLSRTAKQSDEADRSAIQQAGGTQQSQRTVVRRGTSNGRPVVQYSDGTIEYGN